MEGRGGERERKRERAWLVLLERIIYRDVSNRKRK
jgi:hypothetical protein